MKDSSTNASIRIYFFSKDELIVHNFFQHFFQKFLPANAIELAQTLGVEIEIKVVLPDVLGMFAEKQLELQSGIIAETVIDNKLLDKLLSDSKINLNSDDQKKYDFNQYACAWPMELIVGQDFFSNLLIELSCGEFESFLLPQVEIENSHLSHSAFCNTGDNYAFDDLVLDYLADSDKKIAKPSFKFNRDKLGEFTWFANNMEMIRYTNRYKTFIWREGMHSDPLRKSKPKTLNNTRLFPAAFLRNSAANIEPLELTLLCMASEILNETENVLTDNLYQDPIIYSRKSLEVSDQKLIASEFMETLIQWMKALTQAYKTKHIDIPVLVRTRYSHELKLNLDSLESKIEELDKKYIGRTIIFWGMGEFTLFLLHSFKFCHAKVAVTDSDETKFVDNWHGFQCIKKTDLRDYNCILIPASLKSYVAIKESIHELYGQELPVEVVCWDCIGH